MWMGIFVLIVGNIGIHQIMLFLRKHHGLSTDKKSYHRASWLLGALESVAYSVAYAVDRPEFIVAWLGIRTLGRWQTGGPPSQPTGDEGKRAELNIYYIGNLLCVLLGFFAGWLLKQT